MPERALPWVNYNRGRIVGRCPDCYEVLDASLNIHWPSPANGYCTPQIRPEPVPHTCDDPKAA